jgi:hypothetical protein
MYAISTSRTGSTMFVSAFTWSVDNGIVNSVVEPNKESKQFNTNPHLRIIYIGALHPCVCGKKERRNQDALPNKWHFRILEVVSSNLCPDDDVCT